MRGLVRGVLTLLVAGFVLGAAQEVSAQQVLTFDEMGTPPGHPIVAEVVCSAGNGLRFTSDHFHVTGPDAGSPYTSSGSTFLGYESGRGFPIVLSRDGAGTFSLYSLDAGEYYSPPQTDRPDAQWITLTGYQDGGGIVTHSFFLDGLRDGPDGIPDFEPFVLPPTFVNLRSVVFTGWLPSDVAGGLAFDNLAYQLDSLEAVPPCFYIDSTPTVSFVSPSGVVSGLVTVQANAADNAAIESVTFKLNGVEMAPPDTSAPYAIQWDTTLVLDGSYTLTAEARDFTSNVATATLAVTVQNAAVPGGEHYVAFDGVDDLVRISDAPALSFGNGTTDTPFTIEAWLRPESMTGRQQIIGKSGEYRVFINVGTVLVELRDNSLGARTFVYTTGDLSGWPHTWHHVAVTYDGRGGAAAGDGVIIYLDGVAAPVARANNAAYVAMEDLAGPIESGLDSNAGDQYAGGLDELRLWNVTRTENEIATSMDGQLTGIEAGLIGYWRFNEGSGLGSADDSPNDHGAALLGGTTWQSGGPHAADVTAPVITNIVVSNLTPTGATITFTTDGTATAWVSYTQTTCPCTDVNSPTTGTSHTVQLAGLSAETLYHFTVNARDAADNVGTSASMNFTTLAASTDVQPPTVAFVMPPTGTVSGLVNVEASASDDVAVVSVTFTLDGVSLGAPDTAAPYALVWDSTGVSDGAHMLRAEARDAANHVSTASVAVLVQNTPVANTPHYVAFDGVDDLVRVADAPQLSFGNGATDTPFSIEAWVRPQSVAGLHPIASKAGEYRVGFVYGTVLVELRDQSASAGAFVSTNVDLSAWAGNWHHVAVTYDGRGGATAANGVTVYLDGVAVPLVRENAAAYVAMENLANPLDIGVRNQADYYNGGLDELRLWNVLRTAGQIQSAMVAELTGIEAGLAGYWRFSEGVGTSVADDSAYESNGTLMNGTLWMAGGPLVTDSTAPQISNIAVSNITPTGATITFTTNEAATGWISYVAGTACPCTDASSAAIGTSHTVTLTGLASDTDYRFEAKAHDAANNNAVASPVTFRTLPAPDVQSPTVAFVTPAAGTVSGSVTVTASASDNVGVVSVTFKLDGVTLGAPDTVAPYTFVWDSTSVANGAHTLTAEARDAANHVSTATVAVLVQNTPVSNTPSITASSTSVVAGATLTATIANGPGNRLDWAAVCPGNATTGCTGWKYLNGTQVAPASGMTAATLTFTMPATPGQYSVKLFANDTMTLLATTALVTVTAPVSTGPTITPSSTSVSAGATVTATIANGPGNRLDWIAVCPGNATTGCTDWKYLNGLRVAPASGLTAAALSVTMPAAAGQYTVKLFVNDTMTVAATSASITVTAGGGGNTPTVTPSSTTVSTGATVTATIANGPGNRLDWAAVCPGNATTGCTDWKYLNGSRTAPASGLTAATVSFTMPATPGEYTVKLFLNDTMTVAATSASITVTAGGGGNTPTITPSSTTTSGGATVTATIANGPGNRLDWAAVCPGNSSTGCTDWKYLNGTRTAPASGLTAATVSFTMPATPGQYTFKLFVNDSMTVVATSALITVQ